MFSRRILVLLVASLSIIAAAPAVAGSAHAVVSTKSSRFGNILVDSKGRTLYLFEADHGSSTCAGECAAEWPPLTTQGKPRARVHARASLLGTTRRSDGRRQVTYRGHPLYRYIGDTRPGQTNGHGVFLFGALWSVVNSGGRTPGY